MNYTEFINTMQMEIEEMTDSDITVSIQPVMKNNGATRTGLVVSKEGINISPTIYMEEFFQKYLRGVSIQDILDEFMAVYHNAKCSFSWPCEELLSFEKVKGKIFSRLINTEKNKEYLEDVPSIPFLDLSEVFYVMIQEEELGCASLAIKNEHLKMWSASIEEVKKLARQNGQKRQPDTIMKFTDYMYVWTNESRFLGASVILYHNSLQNVADYLGDSFFMIPSSIHEWILIPGRFGDSREELKKMVYEVNRKELEPEEVLSDEVYYYDRNRKLLN